MEEKAKKYVESVGIAVERRYGVMGVLVDRSVEHHEQVVVGMFQAVAIEC